MPRNLDEDLHRWLAAGLVDEPQVAAIRAYEVQRHDEPPARLRWPVLLALAFGSLLLGAGVLLLVAAHWERMGPPARLATVAGLVLAFHLAGAAAARTPKLATALHGLGTLVLGAGIFLAGQIFNLREHWPGGILLWALGAWLGAALLRDWVQTALAALLTPLWLAGEWLEAARQDWSLPAAAQRILAVGVLGLAFAYLAARRHDEPSLARKALAWIGGIALIPAALAAALVAAWSANERGGGNLRPGAAILGWAVALLGPLAVAGFLRRRAAWLDALALAWAAVLVSLSGDGWPIYAWCALGGIGLALWGLHEERPERVNLGVAGFALTVLWFYCSSVLDRLGRSLGLIGLGLLFLLGGWQLERLRRRLTARIRGSAP
jgi:uncharacterized membrane protein